MMEVKKFEKLTYIMKFPSNYDSTKKYPLIFLLHGAGGRGDNIDIIKTNPYFIHTEKHEEFPFISVAPQCCENTWYDLFETLKRFVEYICSYDCVDLEHVYVIGASMGGYATWQLAMSMPEAFAAIVPICGGGMYWNAGRLKDVPVWAFHGAKDKVVFPEESQKMVEAVNQNGGNAKLTVYPECEHASWDDTYSNYEVFQWMLKHTKREGTIVKDKYVDSEFYAPQGRNAKDVILEK